jgi:hypothetical protein
MAGLLLDELDCQPVVPGHQGQQKEASRDAIALESRPRCQP